MIPQHIIFDCDGVLVDSEPLSMELDYLLLRENGINLSREEVMQRFVGLTFGALIEQVTHQFDMRLPDDLIETKDRRLLELFETQLQAVEGAEEALEAIALPRSVASNSPRTRVEAAFRIAGLSRHFGSRITTFEDVSRGKPAPDIYFEAAARAGVRPEECLVVEDSVAGVTAAAGAGCIVLGFTGTVHDREDHAARLSSAGATAVFGHMQQLPQLVASFSAA
jgi:HAD superfamily hydrolase (TIGR01509 family)